MNYMDIAIERLISLRALITKFKLSEFPYLDSKKAFERMGREVDQQLALSRSINNSRIPDKNKKQHALSALKTISDYLPYLGIVLRSTNVRNAFEIFPPLLRLAGELLDKSQTQAGRTINLIISSEWKYSPYIYTNPITPLSNFVVIGLPATEAANPLLIPVAGHELGHMIWNAEHIESIFREQINRQIEAALKASPEGSYNKSLLGSMQTIEKSAIIYKSVTSQAAEIFCDIIATKLFGSAFPLSLCYLLSPGVARTSGYPNNKSRLDFIKMAEEHFYNAPIISIDYSDLLDDASNSNQTNDDLALADKIVRSIFDELLAKAEKCIASRYEELNRNREVKIRIPGPEIEEVERIFSSYKNVIPAERAGSLANIVNAGWRAYLENDLWQSIEAINQSNKKSILFDLILKNIELLEFEEKLKG
jgi:hypothetical protein